MSKHLVTKNRSVITCFCLSFSSHLIIILVFPTILQVVSLADIQSLLLSHLGTLPSFLPFLLSLLSLQRRHVLTDVACCVLWFYQSHFHIAAGAWSPGHSWAGGCPACSLATAQARPPLPHVSRRASSTAPQPHQPLASAPGSS